MSAPSSLIGIIAASSHKACRSLPEYPTKITLPRYHIVLSNDSRASDSIGVDISQLVSCLTFFCNFVQFSLLVNK